MKHWVQSYRKIRNPISSWNQLAFLGLHQIHERVDLAYEILGRSTDDVRLTRILTETTSQLLQLAFEFLDLAQRVGFDVARQTVTSLRRNQSGRLECNPCMWQLWHLVYQLWFKTRNTFVIYLFIPILFDQWQMKHIQFSITAVGKKNYFKI